MLPLALATVIVYKATGKFDWAIFILTLLTVTSVQAAGNVVNTYFDYVYGVDTKSSDDRTLVDRLLSQQQVAHVGVIAYLISIFSFALTVYRIITCGNELYGWESMANGSSNDHTVMVIVELSLVFFGGLSGAFLYTGGIGLKYLALGDVLVVLAFGPFTTLFAALAQSGSLSATPMRFALPLVLTTEAILHANNARDATADKSAPIRVLTLPILLGRAGSYALFCALLFVPYAFFVVLAVRRSRWFLLPVLSVLLALQREREFRAENYHKLPHKVAAINFVSGLLYNLAVFLDPTAYTL